MGENQGGHICFTEFYRRNFFMDAKGRVKDDRAFKFYEQESVGRGISYHARRTTHDARRTTHDPRPTTHDTLPTHPRHAPGLQGHAPGAKLLRVNQGFHGYATSSGAEFPPRKMLHDI